MDFALLKIAQIVNEKKKWSEQNLPVFRPKKSKILFRSEKLVLGTVNLMTYFVPIVPHSLALLLSFIRARSSKRSEEID